MIKFEWDKNKNELNIKKHRLSFEESKDAFYDDYSLILVDTMHNDYEERFFQIGMIRNLKIVCVVFCIRRHDVIRIISARYATKKKIDEYEKQRK